MYDERYHQEFTEEELTNEVWKDIPDFEGYYQASNIGRVRSVDRWITYSDGKRRFYKQQIIKARTDKDGYLRFTLNKNGSKLYRRVNQLIALTFIPNPDGLPVVNHKDENKLNNRVDNLEWCTVAYNNVYGSHATINNRKVTNGEQVFKSINEAAEWAGKVSGLTGDASFISKVCRGKRETAYGYKWGYVDE